MATYVADAVAMNRRIAGELPRRVVEIFDRAEEGLDRIEATPTQMAEVADTIQGNERIARKELQISAREALRALSNGPVTVPKLGQSVFLRLPRLYDTYTMHDAILVAAHKSRQTDDILTNDENIRRFDGEAVVWK